MNRLKLYYLDNKYIDYLRQSDTRVAYNKNQTRPYVGVVYSYNDFTYFAPLSSPKPKHLKMNARNIDIFKIRNGQLGIVNLNNMIPVPAQSLIDFMPTVADSKYKALLNNQITELNLNKDYLLKKVERFQWSYRNNKLPENVYTRTCNFELLEDKCRDYQKEHFQVQTNENIKTENPIQKYCNMVSKDTQGREIDLEKILEK